MWLEAIITHADLVEVLGELLPLKIYLSRDGDEVDRDRWLFLRSASRVELVPDSGLRVTCAAEFRWTIAGIGPTLKIDELRVLLRPVVVETPEGGVLELNLAVEESDFHSLPDLVDATIARAVNAALTTKKIPWGFSETFSRTVPLGAILEQVRALKIEAPWGRLRIGADALALVVSFKLGFVRSD
jgi:hypothetical protein